MCGVVEFRVRSAGGDEDEDLELSVVVLVVDASRRLCRALYGLSSPSALVSSLLGPSAGLAMGIVVIGGNGC